MLTNKKGFGLIEVMVSVAIMTIIGLGAATMITNMQKGVKDVRTLANRDYVGQMIKHFAGDPRAVAASILPAPIQTNFRRCVNGALGGMCPNVQTGLRLYAPGGTQIAGPPGAPIRYTPEGAICLGPASVQCPLEAIAWYTPFCPTTAACGATIAVRLEINYMVRKSAGISGLEYQSVCSNGAPGCVATAPPAVGIVIPLNNPTSVVLNRLAYWSSTTGMTESTARQDANTGNLFLNESAAAACNPSNAGGIRTRNGTLEVCDGPLSEWKNAGGEIDSSVSNVTGYPNLKNLFLCPAGGIADRCGGATPCIGQVTKLSTCCMDRAVHYGPPLPGGVTLGVNADLPCTSLY